MRAVRSCGRAFARRVPQLRFAGSLLPYSPQFGTAAAPESALSSHEPTAVYEQKHRLKGGDLGLLTGKTAGGETVSGPCFAPGVLAACADVASGALEMVSSEKVQPAADHVRLFKAEGEARVCFPSTRFKEGTLVVAAGHDKNGGWVVSPGRVLREVDEDRKLEIDAETLPCGGVLFDMADPKKVFGLIDPKGQVLSVKDPHFVINWAVHCIPGVVPESGKIDSAVMVFVNDMKRIVVRNRDLIPAESFKRCQKVFIRSSVEDFQHYML
eukprot:Hpha_TRINITY_DN3652_c0_g1::TRINITY_DN3652_c0_g1_i1::g.1059::m.1059